MKIIKIFGGSGKQRRDDRCVVVRKRTCCSDTEFPLEETRYSPAFTCSQYKVRRVYGVRHAAVRRHFRSLLSERDDGHEAAGTASYK